MVTTSETNLMLPCVRHIGCELEEGNMHRHRRKITTGFSPRTIYGYTVVSVAPVLPSTLKPQHIMFVDAGSSIALLNVEYCIMSEAQ